MAITELALLHLKPPHSGITQTLRITLLAAQASQSAFSTYPVTFFTDVNDPSYIYLLGGWNTAEHHYNEWIPSSTNQEFMMNLREEVDVDWMFHVDIDPGVVNGVFLGVEFTGEEEKNGIGESGGRIIVLFSMASGWEELFLGAFEAFKREIGGGRVGGGWKVEKHDGEETFVVFCRLEGGQALLQLKRFEGFVETIGAVVTTSDVMHLAPWSG